MLKKYYLFSSIALFFLSGCAAFTSIPAHQNDTQHNKKTQQVKGVKDRDIAPHVLSIDPDGKLNLIGCNEKGKDKPEWCKGVGEKNEAEFYEDNLNKYLENIITKLKKSEKELLIYIHGGLNGERGAIERAKRKYRLILDDEKSPRYPVFVTWRSGGWTTYKDHIVRIRQGEQEEHFLTKLLTAPVYLFTDLANSLANTPKAWTVTGLHMLESTLHAKEEKDVCADINALQGTNIHFNGDQGKSNFFRRARWVATIPSKIVTTPFTYTLAKPAWDIMLRRTSTLFYTPKDLEDKSGNRKKVITYGAHPRMKDGNGALYRFLLSLEKELKEDDVKITLIGHSMGAIVVNQIVNLGLDLRYENIVHMASADSIENLFNKVVPYIDCTLEKDKKAACNKGLPVNFYSLYLHPDNENREVSAKGFTPSGSLLTWIDGMFTVPKTVLDKRSGRWDNMKRAIRLIPPISQDTNSSIIFPALPDTIKQNNNIRGQMHFTIFGIQENKECTEEEGLNCTAQEHGDFGDLPFWREEVWKGEHLSSQGKSK